MLYGTPMSIGQMSGDLHRLPPAVQYSPTPSELPTYPGSGEQLPASEPPSGKRPLLPVVLPLLPLLPVEPELPLLLALLELAMEPKLPPLELELEAARAGGGSARPRTGGSPGAGAAGVGHLRARATCDQENGGRDENPESGHGASTLGLFCSGTLSLARRRRKRLTISRCAGRTAGTNYMFKPPSMSTVRPLK